MRRKTLTVVLSLAMILAMMPVMTGVASAKTGPYIPVPEALAVGGSIIVGTEVYEEVKSNIVKVDEDGVAEVKVLDTAVINASKFLGINDLTIKTNAGTMHLDKEALDVIKAAIGDKKTLTEVKIDADLELKTRSAIRIELSASVKNRLFSDFKDKTVEFTVAVPSKLKDKEVQAIRIGAFGKVEKVDGKDNEDGTYTIFLNKLSTYALVSEELANKLVKEDANLTEEEVNKAITEEGEKVVTEEKSGIAAGVKATTIKADTEFIMNNNGGDKIKVSWTKSKGYKVDYYEVYRSTSKDSGFKKVFTTKNGNATTYTNNAGITKFKTYYYKVRGVREVNGEKVYTKWSNVKKQVFA